MKTPNKFVITVLDDNVFYNRILTKRLKSYTDMLGFAFEKDYEFDIRSYTAAKDCLNELHEDTDVVFLDYFLDNKINAADLLESIRLKCKTCKIVVISQMQTIGTVLQLLPENSVEFIYKDEEALSKSCMIVDDIVTARGGH